MAVQPALERRAETLIGDDEMMRRASLQDVPTLLALMEEFYAEAGYVLDRTLAGAAFEALLSDEHLGYVWLIDEDVRTVGYVVVTLRFGMEYAGIIACLDDLFVVPASRNKGFSTAALAEVRDFCTARGVRAMTVEVGVDNAPAQAVYRRTGLVVAPNRQVLAMALASPAHAV